MWGWTEPQIAQFGMTVGLALFMAYMVFIIVQLARQSQAGRFGTLVLFAVLALGMLGFVAKGLIQHLVLP